MEGSEAPLAPYTPAQAIAASDSTDTWAQTAEGFNLSMAWANLMTVAGQGTANTVSQLNALLQTGI